ncbi:eukaryotic translation initiation factor 3 [Plasmodium falciparum RAJ116]|uniref:Eukaryotic translation initiation factor 3 n=1 Tax=Plasmodium falciparum RAJ116 TaxID=580058 RepID=A0A0L0CZC8_PLAFA|nr:eukaryotic translation initiation factor 3 [Plasmodium falciparum RAJ116]
MEENNNNDLTGKICSYLDPHMVQIILTWLKENKVGDVNDLEKNLELLNEGCDKEIALIENECTNGNRGVINNYLESVELEIDEFQEAMNEYKIDQMNRIGSNLEKKSIVDKNKMYTFSDNIDDKILKLSRYYYQKKDYVKSKQYLLLYILNISEMIINISDHQK